MMDDKSANKHLAGFSNFRHRCSIVDDGFRYAGAAATAHVFRVVVVTVKMDGEHGLHAGHVDLARRASSSAEVTPVSDGDQEPAQYENPKTSSAGQSKGVLRSTARLLGIRQR